MEQGNAINVYRCPMCHWQAVTINRVEGVTPMFIRCESKTCASRNDLPGCFSAMYRVSQQLEPTHEWYRPEEEELLEKPWARAHVEAGGLMLRRIQGRAREIHVAGLLVAMMQRCIRCGEVLSDYRNSMIPKGDPVPVGWTPGVAVEIVRGFPMQYLRVEGETPTCDAAPADAIEAHGLL